MRCAVGLWWVVGEGGALAAGGGGGGGGAGERWRCPESEAVDLLGVYLAWRARGADEAAAAACGLSAKVTRTLPLTLPLTLP